MGKGIGFGMISCVERTSLHFCSDAAAARVANTPMQPSGASHRLCEAYCQRLTGRSFPDAHAAFHDVFFRGEPSARCGRSGRVVGASRRPVRSWDAPRRLSCPAEPCSRWPARASRVFRAIIFLVFMRARTRKAVLGGLMLDSNIYCRTWPWYSRASTASTKSASEQPAAALTPCAGRRE